MTMDFSRLGPPAGTRLVVLGGCGGIGRVLISAARQTGLEVANLDLITPVPGPLPLFGFAAAYGWSRSLRRRLRSSAASA